MSSFPPFIQVFALEIAWMRDVRDPAEIAAEGKRTLTAGGASASYRIAQLPDGTWAICIQTKLEMVTGMTIPWRVLPTRVLRRALREVADENAYPVLYFHPYELDPRPLRQTTTRMGRLGLAVHRNVIRPPLAACPSFEE